MSCDLGDGNPFHVETALASKYALCDNQWHNITALYESEQIAIRIDNQPSIIALAHRISGKVHSKSPLYIGGLPGKFEVIDNSENQDDYKMSFFFRNCTHRHLTLA
jgi:Laminin G domain